MNHYGLTILNIKKKFSKKLESKINEEIFKMEETVLVVAPHPDDETLGCGGTLLKHKANGHEVFWLIVTNIDTKNGWASKNVQRRQKEIQIVTKMYGFTKTFKLDYPAARLDDIALIEIITRISSVIQEIRPSIVYLPNSEDVHTDHRLTFDSAMSSCKNFRAPFIKKILMYECLSESEFGAPFPDKVFRPNVFMDISEFFEKKLNIIQTYESEVMESYLPRSLLTIEAAARLRGSRIGVKYAEAFMLLFQKC